MTATTTATVTTEQIARCRRGETTNEHPFYMVRSESNTLVEYKVSAIRKQNKWYTVCSCPAGLRGIPCKHIRWAKAATNLYKESLKAMARLDAHTAVQTVERPWTSAERRDYNAYVGGRERGRIAILSAIAEARK